MQIGRFWGFTAPMLMLASPDKMKLAESFSLLNTGMNRKILQDLKAEFYILGKAENLLYADYSLPDDSVLLAGGWVCRNGQFVFEGEGSELQQLQAENDLVFILADMIAKGENKGRLVDVPGSGALRDRLLEAVHTGLQGQSFQADGLRAAVRKIYRSLPHGTEPFGTDLARELGALLRIPDSVMSGGQESPVSKEEGRILSYFAGRVQEAKEFCDMVNVGTVRDEQVFGISFFHLVNRKPESLLYMVLNQFDHVKTSRQAASVIRNVIADVDANVKMFRECLDRYVDVYAGTSSAEGVLSLASFNEVVEGFEPDKQKFFRDLQRKGFTAGDYLKSDLDMLSWLYDMADGLNQKKMAEAFGVDSVDDAILEGMCRFGICGLNLYQKELFSDAVACIPLTTRDKLHKSREEIEEINGVLGLVDSLLDSLLPIGAEL